MLARGRDERPQRRSSATASPYRTPISAASFYSAPGSSPSGSPRRTPKSSTSASPDSSRDEIDFLAPRSLHGRMRSKNASVESLEVPLRLIAIDGGYCDDATTLVSFATHLVVYAPGASAKIALRDISDWLVR